MAFSYYSMDISQRNSFKWLLWPKRHIDAELYKQLPFGNDLKRNTKRYIWHLFYPQNSGELILWYLCDNVYVLVVDAHWSNNSACILLQFHTRHFQQWAILEKIQTLAGGEDMEFPGISNKRLVKISELN